MAARDCQKTSLKTCATEQRGVCAGGKKPTARSIKQDFETFFESFKIRTAWRKDFFDTLGRPLWPPVKLPAILPLRGRDR